MDTDYADDRALLANTPTQAESLLPAPGYAAGGIDLNENTNKMEYMCFNWEGAILTLNGSPLKLIDKSSYVSSSISSTESDVNMCLAKA